MEFFRYLKVTTKSSQCLYINQFDPNAPFLYPLKTSENVAVFRCFQRVEEGCIGNKWVKQTSNIHIKSRTLDTYIFGTFNSRRVKTWRRIYRVSKQNEDFSQRYQNNVTATLLDYFLLNFKHRCIILIVEFERVLFAGRGQSNY